MSSTSTISTAGRWEAKGVTVGRVEQALLDLRREERRAAVRTSVLTLVVVVHDRQEAEIALSTIHDLGARHPSRSLVLILDDESDESENNTIDAAASVQVVETDGRAVCFEDVILTIRGTARHHLDSVTEPFSLPDVPLVVWLPNTLPSTGDPLMAAANRVVVDSRVIQGESEVLSHIARLARRIPVADLSWIRLAPWRTLLAGLFEGNVYRPFVQGVTSVEVAGRFSPRHLLGGWLLKRLDLSLDQVRLTPAEHVSVCIDAIHEGHAGSFAVRRTDPQRVIEARVDIDGGPTLEQTLRMREQWPSLALAGALTRVGHDLVYEEALSGAGQLIA